MKDKVFDAVVVAGGEYPTAAQPLAVLQNAPLVVCCDGAADRHIATGREPDAIVGDGDSISDENREKYAHLLHIVPEQESNDQTKAVRWAINNINDIENIYILGATGGRPEHTVGNAGLLMEYTRMFDLEGRGIMMESVSDFGTMFAVTDTVSLDCGEGRQVSIFSPDNTLKISSEGLKWPTDDVVFDNWWKATLNMASQDTVKLTFSHKSLALIMMN